MPRVNNIPDLTVQDDEEEILILPLEERAKRESSLLEVNNKVEEEINVGLQKVREELEDIKKGEDNGKGKVVKVSPS